LFIKVQQVHHKSSSTHYTETLPQVQEMNYTIPTGVIPCAPF